MKRLETFFFAITHPEKTVFPYALPQTSALTTAVLTIRFFYVVLLYFAFTRITLWEHYYYYASIVDPLWPISWIMFTDTATAYLIILALFFGGTFLAALFPFYRLWRIVAFIGFFEYAAYLNSFGKIDHPWHIWILVAFIFIFLPSGKKDNNSSYAKHLFFIFWFAQAFTLLTYSMSGLWKVIGIVEQFFKGEIHALLPQAMALQIANRLLSTNQSSILGPWLIENYWWGWLLLPGGIFVEFFSLYIAFKPKLHKLWGTLLILLHIGNYFIMAIPFRDTILLLALLFLNTPFEKPGTKWQERLEDFPVIGFFWKAFHTSKTSH